MRKQIEVVEDIREKIQVFILPETLYVLESMAIQAGYVRKLNSSLIGRAKISPMIDNWLEMVTGVNRMTKEQRLQLRTHMVAVLDSRKLKATRLRRGK